jgi:HD-GYP domain-containing protein (c-di-GMP phosphodiesterase class II)
MTALARGLKAAWTRRLLELSLPQLPEGTSAALWFGDKCLAAVGPQGDRLCQESGAVYEERAGLQNHPLKFRTARVGTLLVAPPEGAEDQANAWGQSTVFALQALIEAEHARREVGQETLESYREMALMQRAMLELNRSLKPAAVAAALLREFNSDKSGADFGAVFLNEGDGLAHDPVSAFGENAAEEFARLRCHPVFGAMAASPGGDIVDDVRTAGGWGDDMAFRALLWLPLVAHEERLGLLVFASRRTEAFAAGAMKRAQALAAVAATALRNAQLYAAQQEMFHAFVRVIATAIDAKSPYTAGHCRRVPEIALMLADAAHRTQSGPLAGFTLDEEERQSLELAAMLHDCGKVVTPEWVVDKATKLDALVDRMGTVRMRFEVLRRDAELEFRDALAAGVGRAEAERQRAERLHEIDDDVAFVEKANRGSEFVDAGSAARLRAIAARRWRDGAGVEQPLLTEDELLNLLIPRGTLNASERKIIEDHALHTFKMLSQIPFPPELRNVTEYASCHHERLNGGGYPRGLKEAELSIPARIVAIADIFEALTAPDRPYRKPSTLSWAVDTMHKMKQEGHIDGDLFEVFLRENLHLAYADLYLAPAQIDAVDVSRYLGEPAC